MTKRRIIVIGGVAAGPSAAALAKRKSPESEVLIYQQDTDISHGVCELPYLIGGEIETDSQLVFFTPEEFERQKSVKVLVRHRVEKIQPLRKQLNILDLNSGQRSSEFYDRLIIATGSRSRIHPAFPSEASNLVKLRSLNDGRNFLAHLNSKAIKQVCIIGAGYIGLETAEALLSRGIAVTLITNDQLPLPGFDTSTREAMQAAARKAGATILTGTEVLSVGQSGSTLTTLETSQGRLSADLYMMAMGLEPNTSLASDAGIGLGNLGGIRVDQRQMTSIDGIYAAGDCCELTNLITRKAGWYPFAGLANRTGRIAGENAAGGRAELRGVVPVSAVAAFGMEFAHVGLTEKQAHDSGFSTVTSRIRSHDRVPILPGAKPLGATMTVDARSARILGADIWGEKQAALRINTVSMAIRQSLTVKEFSDSDFLYTPRLSPLTDPFIICARRAMDLLDDGKV